MSFESTKERLLAAAGEAGFGDDLTDAERRLLECVATGTLAHCKGLPDEKRTIRSALLEWLLIHPDPRPLLHPKGVQLSDAVFAQKLDLQETRIDIPLWFFGCTFEDAVILRLARTRMLAFQGCTVRSISADGVQVDGGLFLRDKFHATGEVRLVGATIAGYLDCREARFENAGGVALTADSIHVNGNIFLIDKFHATGAVRLVRATIGGNLECDGAHFENDGGRALHGDGIDVKGNVFMRDKFHATGEVRLVGATIGGNLDCTGARFENDSAVALSADSSTVGGGVFLRAGFRSSGKVTLPGARIDRCLQLQQSVLRCGKSEDGEEDPVALDLTNASVADYLGFVDHWRHEHPAEIHGRVLLRHAHVGQLDDSAAVWRLDDAGHDDGEPVHESVPVALDGFTYTSLGRAAGSLDVEFRKRWLKSGEDFGGPFAPQPYSQLAQVLRNAGHDDRARLILLEQNWERLRRLKGELGKGEYAWSTLFGWVVGFGYRTRRALFGLLALWLIGFLIFAIGWYGGKFNPAVPFVYNSYRVVAHDAQGAPIEEQRHAPPYGDLTENPHRLRQYPKFYSLIYSLDTLLPIVNLHQEPYWLPTGCVRAYLWLHIIAGWFFTTMIVVGLTGFVRKE